MREISRLLQGALFHGRSWLDVPLIAYANAVPLQASAQAKEKAAAAAAVRREADLESQVRFLVLISCGLHIQ